LSRRQPPVQTKRNQIYLQHGKIGFDQSGIRANSARALTRIFDCHHWRIVGTVSNENQNTIDSITNGRRKYKDVIGFFVFMVYFLVTNHFIKQSAWQQRKDFKRQGRLQSHILIC
jgi:hypothetical protein